MWLTACKGTLARSLIANRDGIGGPHEYQKAGRMMDGSNRWSTLRVSHMGWEAASASGIRKVRPDRPPGRFLLHCIALYWSGLGSGILWDSVGSSLFFHLESAGACTSVST